MKAGYSADDCLTKTMYGLKNPTISETTNVNVNNGKDAPEV